MEFKARLVAKGFQEVDKLQSDSPTVAKESLKLLIALGANEDFELATMDIRAAHLWGNTLDRDVFIKITDSQRRRDGMEAKEAIIWFGQCK